MNEALIGSILIAIVLIVILMILVSCIKIVPQATAMVVERLGGYKCTWSVGLHVKAPFIDRVAKRVILKEQVVDFAFSGPGGPGNSFCPGWGCPVPVSRYRRQWRQKHS